MRRKKRQNVSDLCRMGRNKHLWSIGLGITAHLCTHGTDGKSPDPSWSWWARIFDIKVTLYFKQPAFVVIGRLAGASIEPLNSWKLYFEDLLFCSLILVQAACLRHPWWRMEAKLAIVFTYFFFFFSFFSSFYAFCFSPTSGKLL